MNDDRCDEPRPRRRERQANERHQRDTEDAGADRNQGRRGNGIASDLDCRIPACVAGGSEEDSREDERIQGDSYQSGLSVSCPYERSTSDNGKVTGARPAMIRTAGITPSASPIIP